MIEESSHFNSLFYTTWHYIHDNPGINSYQKNGPQSGRVKTISTECIIMMKRLHVLLVEDNEFDSMVIQKVLNNHESVLFVVTHVTTLQEAQYHCVTNNYDVILLDLSLPDCFGIETFKKLSFFSLDKPVIIMSGIDDEDLTVQTIKEGAQDFIIKGMIDKALFPQYILFAIERNRHLRESANPYLIDDLTGLYNERGFTFLAQQLLKIASRTNIQFHFFYIELSNLDFITEHFNYDEVHFAMTKSTQLIKKTFHELDLIARTKTNKFSILALHEDGLSSNEISDRFHREVESFNQSFDGGFTLEFHVGLVEYDPAQFATFESIFKKSETKVKQNTPTP